MKHSDIPASKSYLADEERTRPDHDLRWLRSVLCVLLSAGTASKDDISPVKTLHQFIPKWILFWEQNQPAKSLPIICKVSLSEQVKM